MSTVDNPYRSWGMIADQAEVNERADFIRKTYLHLGGAVLAFAILETVLLNLPGIENIVGLMFANRFGWLIVMGAFVGVSWIADSWARSATSVTTQYLGLGLYVVAEAVVFLPLLYIAHFVAPRFGAHDVIPTAGILTLLVFGGLTGVVVISGKDFSFLRTGLTVASCAAMGLIVCSMLFGFNLGVVFMAAMVALASGYIIYDTSNVLHQYRIGQHVAASLALFASVALLFWYMVQLVMSLSSRD